MLTTSFRTIAGSLLLVLLAGCGFQTMPFKSYEGDMPLSNTAVLIAVDKRLAGQVVMTNVVSVDGAQTEFLAKGPPLWVRVLPGDHEFVISYQANWRPGSHDSASLKITVKDMKALHVYVARYSEWDRKVSVQIEDLGERPDYGLTLGGTYYRATF